MDNPSKFWAIAGLVVAAAVHGVVMLVATLWVLLGTQGLCGDPAEAVGLHDARIQLAVLVALAVLPWAAGLVRAWARGREGGLLAGIVVAGLAVSAYPAYWLVAAVQAGPAEWTIDWCLL